MFQSRQFIQDFYVAGLSYKKADATLRGQFSLSSEQYECLLADAANYGVHEVFILSTCNRTEIYGFGYCVHQLIELLCEHVAGSSDDFRRNAYIKKNDEAAQHLFEVAAGLDSQILGDYEIIGQIKQAVSFSRERGFMGAYTERLVNTALSASKAIKNETALSNGSVSVAYTAVQYLLKLEGGQLSEQQILVVGAGQMGSTVCKNLVANTSPKNITIINRTQAKADALAAELGIRSASSTDLETELEAADIIVLATNSTRPIIHADHLVDAGNKTVIDLAVPGNVAASVPDLGHITFANVDELSKTTDATLRQRQSEIPKARMIIEAQFEDFLLWNKKRKHAPYLKAIKNTLQQIQESPVMPERNDNAKLKIQQVVRYYAKKVHKDPRYGCHCIEAINQYIN